MDLSKCLSSGPDDPRIQMRPICSHIGARPSGLLMLQGRVVHAYRLRLQPLVCSTGFRLPDGDADPMGTGLQIKRQEIWSV
jgi:hypothetical protein